MSVLATKPKAGDHANFGGTSSKGLDQGLLLLVASLSEGHCMELTVVTGLTAVALHA